MAAGRSRALPLLVAALLATPLAAAVEVPFLSGHVNDTAAMIPAGVREQIETKLAAFEKTTGAQVVVLTVPSLNGEPIEDYSIKVAQTWKLGRKGVDDGVLFLVARDDRRMRIEVGYGLEA
ncbi:MAG TPA: TPM domain-containing protein, partial [Thermoanaerobaculaceae bacterium]|nr:TPM domain-containing protein [Thermoanaerobaculaceae bacterium]